MSRCHIGILWCTVDGKRVHVSKSVSAHSGHCVYAHTHRQIDREKGCDVILLDVGLRRFYNRKSLASGSGTALRSNQITRPSQSQTRPSGPWGSARPRASSLHKHQPMLTGCDLCQRRQENPSVLSDQS